MKRAIFTVMVLVVSAGISGCARVHCWQMVPFPDQSKIVENPDMARIYLMRDTVLADDSTIRDGDTYIGILTAHFYFCWEREPGKAVISTFYGAANKHTKPLELEVEKGRVYYIHEHSFFPLSSLELISEEEGKRRVQRCHPARTN